METIKKGSKGAAVKQLQELLKITADGIFAQRPKQPLKHIKRSKD